MRERSQPSPNFRKLTPGLNNEGRLVDGAIAQGIMDAVRGKNGIITSFFRKKKPVPCYLSSLQKTVAPLLGMQQTVQAEKKASGLS